MWQQLIDLFIRLEEAYEKIRVLAEKKHGLLVMINLAELEKILKQEEKLADAVKSLEEKRQSILRQLAAADKRIASHTKMEELCAFAPRREIREELLGHHDKLNNLVQKVKELQENNEVLTLAALQAVKANLNRLGGATVSPTYGSAGQDKVTHRQNFEFKA